MPGKKNPEIISENMLKSSASLEGDDRHHRIIQQLQKILTSPEFQATDQQKDFLSFVVKEALAGKSDQLKGYTVATQVFGRDHDFDSKLDPIVSIQANKLRRALERYYLVEGRLDPIIIEIPKGAYKPTFTGSDTAKSENAPGKTDSNQWPEDSWPTLLVRPFENLTGDADQDYLGTGISTELAIEMSLFENVRVIYPRERTSIANVAGTIRFLLDGQIHKDAEGLKLAVYLSDTKTGAQIWGDVCKTGLKVEEILRFQEQVAKIVATKICGDFGIIPKTISRESRYILPINLTSYQALLRFWEYEQTLSPETFKRALEALTHAIKLEPNCCHTQASLAVLYGNIHNLDIGGFENPLKTAVEFAENAVSLNPNNQRISVILALIRFYSNELPAAISAAHEALALNPNSLFIMDGIAFILTLSGDWENGPCLAEKAIKLNPYHRIMTHDALWVNFLRQHNYELAYEEAFFRTRPEHFWDPLIKASTCGLLEQPEEGRKQLERLLQLRPDFPSKQELLIRNYIKFEEIYQTIDAGLRKAGLKSV